MNTIKRAALTLAFAALVALANWAPTEAYELDRVQWSGHNCFTHSNDQRIVDALARWSAQSNVQDCGVSANPDIEYGGFLTNEYPASVAGAAAVMSWQGVITHCTIQLRKGWPETDPIVMTHEVGHCLGLEHSDVANTVMYYAHGPNEDPNPQPDDVAGMQALYGRKVETTPKVLRFQLRLALIAH